MSGQPIATFPPRSSFLPGAIENAGESVYIMANMRGCVMKNTLCLFFAFSVFGLAAASAGAAPLIRCGGELLLKSAPLRQAVFEGRGAFEDVGE